jgi:chloride channel 3/4/5
MAIGASFGRMVGIIVESLHENFPNSAFFSACEPNAPCITPGTYAFLGAGAALSGIMHLTVSVVVIMFELTGALTYILPTMIVVGITKAVSERFGRGGIADRMIWFNGFPFLDNKEEHVFGVPVSHTMTTNPTTLLATGLTIADVDRILSETTFQGFPIIEDADSRTLIGYIGRTELRYALDRAKRDQQASRTARCFFSPLNEEIPRSATTPSASLPAVTFDDIAETAGAMSVDFSKFVDPTPLAVHPRLPLETVMELFKKLGPRVILVEHRGKLMGLVTVKDCLKFQFTVDASHEGHNGEEDPRVSEREEKLWGFLRVVGEWVVAKVGKVSGGRLRLGEEGGYEALTETRAEGRNGDSSQAQALSSQQQPQERNQPRARRRSEVELDRRDDVL